MISAMNENSITSKHAGIV